MRQGRIALCVLLGLLLLFLPPLPLRDTVNGDRPEPPRPGRKTIVLAEDEKQLQKDVKARDAAAVLGFFRKRTPSPAEAERLRRLVRQFGDDSFSVRDQALTELLGQGRIAVSFLRRARYHPDAEVAARARQGLDTLGDTLPDLLPSAARLMADARPDGALAVLLGYFPFADSDATADAVLDALRVLGVRDGQADKALLQALDDAEPLRRAGAAEVLLRAGTTGSHEAARKLLLDPETEVRWRISHALVKVQERSAVPVLIDLLAEVDDERQELLEGLLSRLAGAHTPAAPRGTDAASRRRCRDAWMAWWRDRADTVDLSKLPPAPTVGSTSVVLQMDLDRFDGQALELNAEGQGRLCVPALNYPIGLQVLAEGLLIAEYRSGRVTERNRQGEVVWKYAAPGPVVASQRLADGHTFVALRNRLLEVDARGQEVLSLPRPVRDVAAARRGLNGHIVVVTLTGVCQRLDGEGKEVCRFPVGTVALGAGIDVLPTLRVLVPEYAADCVAEYDPDGRVAWRAAVEKPTAAVRLVNGHTLIGSTTTRMVTEVDRFGQVVWQHQVDEAVMAVGRRQN